MVIKRRRRLSSFLSDASAPILSDGTVVATDPGALSAQTGINFTILPGVTTGTLNFPRIGSPRIAERTYAQDDAAGVNDRDFIARSDIAVIGLFADGSWDTGVGGFLTRAQVYDDLHARNPNLVIFDYQAVMEGGLNSDKGTIGQNEIGPIGNGGTWQPNDWIGRDINGNTVGSFGSSVNYNITAFVTEDVNGNKFPRRIFEYNDTKHMVSALPVLPGKGGCNLFFDVYDRAPLLNDSDFNRDGIPRWHSRQCPQ